MQGSCVPLGAVTESVQAVAVSMTMTFGGDPDSEEDRAEMVGFVERSLEAMSQVA